MGVLIASARSVREEKSKQRHALQEFSHIRVSLVKGKSGWRVGSVEALGNVFLACETREARAACTDLIKSIRRYVHGETPLMAVFDDLCEATYLCATDPEPARIAELFSLRLLSQLGYIAHPPTVVGVLDPVPFTEALALFDDTIRREATGLRTAAAAASHL
jgi:recombinational DNA repair protein (RecF pathway)